MLTYKARYKVPEQGVHAEVLDFPGTISFGENLLRYVGIVVTDAGKLRPRTS